MWQDLLIFVSNMTYFKNILYILFVFFSLNIQGQQILGVNLINNPSFEEYYNCPYTSGQLYESKYWWGITTEYFNACAAPGGVSVPVNYDGFHYAHTGVAYAGCVLYWYANPSYDYRETIKTKLKDTLIANKRYCTNFYTTLAQFTYTYTQSTYILLDSIGMLFTKDSVQDSVPLPILSNGTRVQNIISNLDSINWFKIPNTFIANGGELYLTIGNFNNVISYPSDAIGATYVYIDDVTVCECSFKFSLGNDTTLCIGQSLTLNPNMPNAVFTWQDGSHGSTYKVTQAGTYWVRAYFADYNITTYDTINVAYYTNPIINLGNDTTLCSGQSLILNDTNQNYLYLWQDSSTNPTYNVTQQGFYWVKVTDSNNCTASDTINIMYKDCDTTQNIDNIISIYPNPATDNLTIETNFNEEHRLEVINLLGQTIYTTYIGRKSIINTSNYSCGLYILKIYTDNEIVVKKFVKE